MEEIFRETMGNRVEEKMETAYVFQELEDLPEGIRVPEGRVKPWGTAHALLACRHIVDGPFVAINADDYYGKQSFRDLFAYLSSHEDDDQYRFVMGGYHLINTLTDNGHVSRGVCTTDDNGYLTDITERTKIIKLDGHPAYTEDDGATWNILPDLTPVSMNMWGFSTGFLKETEQRFEKFLREAIPENPLKCEYYIPSVVDELLREKKATVKVIETPDKWYGVTYKADKPLVMEAIARMENEGLYPRNF